MFVLSLIVKIFQTAVKLQLVVIVFILIIQLVKMFMIDIKLYILALPGIFIFLNAVK